MPHDGVMLLPELLRGVQDRTLEITGENIWKVLRHRAFIEVIGKDENVIHGVPDIKKVSGFRLTHRGREALQSDKESLSLPFNKADPPLSVRLWVSAFRRWSRNCPKGLHLSYSDGKLHVLVADKEGKVADDEAHRLSSMAVPWAGEE